MSSTVEVTASSPAAALAAAGVRCCQHDLGWLALDHVQQDWTTQERCGKDLH